MSRRNQPDQNQDQQESREQLQALQRQQALRRALRDANQTQDIADDTSTKLAVQGEQISRISKKLDGMEQDLKTADYHTTTIGSWFGQMWNALRGQPKTENASAGETTKSAADVGLANQVEQQRIKAQLQQDLMKKRQENDAKNNNNNNNNNRKNTVGNNNNSTSQSEQQQQQQQKDAHDKIEEDLLDQLHATVHGVMHSAKLQNSTIRAQTAALQETTDKMDKVDGHMRQTTKKINRLI